jgi:Cytochrome c554 and c-prime
MPASLRSGPAVLTIVDPATASAEPGLYFKIEAKDGSYVESAFTGFGSDLQERTEKIDVITGSGRRGQTYLYWEGDRLFELPVSYWTDGHRWINSPGYQNGSADFSRPVNPGCMECHSTFVQALSSDPLTNRYDKASLVTGISCETCHGPGAEHVSNEKAAGGAHALGILNPAQFSRDRQVELCALCHNGIQREEIAPAFSYLPGQPLSNYFKPIPSDSVEHPDVHGNQVGLLERSRCYRESAKMSCSTCHDVHKPEQAAATYSQRCMGCHRPQSCGVVRRLGLKNAGNCIDCHMPVEPTSVIVSETAGREVRATMRNHWIKVYPQKRR